MDSKFFAVLILLFSTCNVNITGLFFRRNSVAHISNLEITADPKLVAFNSTLLHTANQSQFTVYLNFLSDIKVVFLEMHVRHFSEGSYVPSFLNLHVNCCDFLRMKNSLPILEQIYDHLRNYGKFADRCPVKKDLYYGKQMEIPISIFPSVLPTDKYRIDLFSRLGPGQNSAPLLNISVFFEFKKGSINRFLSMSIFYPLSKLTNCMILTHPLVTRYIILGANATIHLTNEIILMYCLGMFVFAFVAALLLYYFFEAPTSILLSIIYSKIVKIV